MTALARYDLLESVGWYAESSDAEAREVLVAFGDASLTILKFDESPLAHWPLGSLVEMAGAAPMTLAPDIDAPERLTLSDADMIAAIRAVRPAVHGARRRPGARRRVALLRWLVGAAVVALAASMLWTAAPMAVAALAERTPAAARAALGDAAIAAFAGASACDTVKGRRALMALARRLAAAGQNDAVVLRVVDLPAPVASALPAPGGRIVLFREMVTAAQSPRDLAVAASGAMAQAALRSPTAAALTDAGFGALRRAVTGELRGAGLTAAAAEALRTPALAAPERAAPLVAHIMQTLDAEPEPLLTAPQFEAVRTICAGA